MAEGRQGRSGIPFRFTVDTHVFRELGEYLVGRNSTALIEMVKNAYDADATEIVVYGEHLDEPEHGRIVLADNGSGMTVEQFVAGFLRIASRVKSEGDRLSPRFRRRYTGAKGVGRLAAHKLARELRVTSIPCRDDTRVAGVDALIDWDAIEARETLDELDDVLVVRPLEASRDHGTRIELRRLRERWSDNERDVFIREVLSFRPPLQLLHPVPREVLPTRLLFDGPVVRERHRNDPGFDVRLDGVFERGDEFWPAIYNVASWLLEIDATGKRVRYGIAPLSRARTDHPDATRRVFEVNHPSAAEGPRFQARVFVRTGKQLLPEELATANAGIGVFLEGFRVLPYGELGDDWLAIDRDSTTRSAGALRALDEMGVAVIEKTERDELMILPNRQYHGAVFLTETGAPHLRMLVNREGFLPDEHFERLRLLVRTGVDLTTRVRAYYREEIRETRRQARAVRARARAVTDDPNVTPSVAVFAETMGRLTVSMSRVSRQLEFGDAAAARAALKTAQEALEDIRVLATDLITEEAMLRVLASVGTQMSAVVHELSGLAAAARDIARLVDRLRARKAIPADERKTLASVERGLRDLQHSLERQAAYLVDVVSADARRRRSRQYVAERFAAAVRLVDHVARQREIAIENEIPTSLRTPPMFPAELTSVLSNLLTNAVKAAGPSGRVLAHGRRQGEVVVVHIENTGEAVDLTEAERWFEPFASTTTDVHPILGQGMGLGLTIARRIVEEYRGSISFVEPSSGFATAVEIRFEG